MKATFRVTWNYVQQPCTWDIKLLEVTAKSLELQLQFLNMSLRYFRVYPSYIVINAF